MAELAPQDAILASRRPTTFFTDDYLNDPIQFTTDQDFIPESIISQNQFFAVVTRDSVEYVNINLNSSGSVFYPISMTTPTFQRDPFFSQINTIFSTF